MGIENLKYPLEQYRVKNPLPKEGHVFEYDGVSFEDKLELVFYELNFCGCGLPTDAAKYLLEVLIHLRDIDVEYETKEKKRKEMFSSDGAEYFMWYWLEGEGFTEHGSSVPGWLTEKGEKLLKLLEESLKV